MDIFKSRGDLGERALVTYDACTLGYHIPFTFISRLVSLAKTETL